MRVVATLLPMAATWIVLVLFLAGSAQAGGRRPLLRRIHPDIAPHPPHGPIDPRALYPKYDGGFHARALQNLGVPTGDIGLRGNGFMMNPW